MVLTPVGFFTYLIGSISGGIIIALLLIYTPDIDYFLKKRCSFSGKIETYQDVNSFF